MASVFRQRLRNRWSWWTGRGGLPVWYAAEYRLGLPAYSVATGFDPRRAEHVVAVLLETRVLHRSNLRVPSRVELSQLLLVHDAEYIQGLATPINLARCLALKPSEICPDFVLDSLRRATQGTVDAATASLMRRGPVLNLLGGFHRAGRACGAGIDIFSDVAVAIAQLRMSGMNEQIAVIDLDAHSPSGMAECLKADHLVWIGSISGPGSLTLENVDEVILSRGASDQDYLLALDRLLRRCPPARLTFVIAGGDCLSGDRQGELGLSLVGMRERDHRVHRHLTGRASVWLPGGGYSPHAWRALAQTALVLVGRGNESISEQDPWLARSMARIARSFPEAKLGESKEFDANDWLRDLIPSRGRKPLFLGYYTASGIEFALHRLGLLDEIRRLGYSNIHVEFDRVALGERLRLFADSATPRRLIAETVVEVKKFDSECLLYIHWLELRHPSADAAHRRYMPGQSFAGLGLLREVGELYALASMRLGLSGFACIPSHYHIAVHAYPRLRFVDDERQGRFEAMLRDFEGLPLERVADAVEAGRCRLNGIPYCWEASSMACWLDGRLPNASRVGVGRDSAAFTLLAETDLLDIATQVK